MLRPFKEIWYGAFFGIGAILIDVNMHSRMRDLSFWDELTAITGEMAYYRLIYLAFGLTAGWLMWRNNQRERKFRALQERFEHFRGQVSPLVTMIYSRIQIVLTRPEHSALSQELTDALQAAHGDLLRLKSTISEESNPRPTELGKQDAR